MIFTSFDFLLFFLVVLAIQAVLPHRPRNLFLLAASYFFYGCWDWRFLSLIMISTLVDYHCSHGIAASQSAARRKLFLTVSIATNLSILGFFKYANFFVESAHNLLGHLGVSGDAWHLNIVLPVGISFYTFQTISYTVDVYRGELKPLERLTDFALYLSFFPQLVAGPIERGVHFAPQLLHKPKVSLFDIYDGSWLILKGVFKKAVIADNMAILVDGVFSQTAPSGPEILIAVYAFAFQIYGDFAGYSDIARGVARMMGYRLMLNFRIPYLATSPSDFWQRWHISLSSWLRDYLYIPLGGNRHGTWMTYRNLMLTMVLGGLWHGAAWTFVLWGAFHGAILVLYRMVGSWLGSGRISERSPAATASDPPASGRVKIGGVQRHGHLAPFSWALQVFLMFHLTCFGWLIFRAESLSQLSTFLAQLAAPWSFNSELPQMVWQFGLLALPLITVWLLEERTKNLNIIPALSVLPRAAAYAGTILAILILGQFGGREFIYFQF